MSIKFEDNGGGPWVSLTGDVYPVLFKEDSVSEMVERVARAQAILGGHFLEEFDLGEREVAFDFARAAITAMREPTDAMRNAFYVDNYGDADKAWQAMIDAALKVTDPAQ